MAELTIEQKAAEEAARAAAAAREAAIPVPPKGADYDTVASIHQQLLVDKRSEDAHLFHKKYVLGFKAAK